jgi:hypothetical protein
MVVAVCLAPFALADETPCKRRCEVDLDMCRNTCSKTVFPKTIGPCRKDCERLFHKCSGECDVPPAREEKRDPP